MRKGIYNSNGLYPGQGGSRLWNLSATENFQENYAYSSLVYFPRNKDSAHNKSPNARGRRYIAGNLSNGTIQPLSLAN